MKVTKTRHLGYSTRMSEAKNDEERKDIFVLKWPKAVSMLETKANFFAEMVEECRRYETWKLLRAGYKSFEEFCSAKLSMTLDEVSEIVDGVNRAGGRLITRKEAVQLATKAGPLLDVDVKRGRPVSGSNPTTSKDRGLSYTVRRLLRDHPALHAKVAGGEMSANAAAIEAGFRKKPTPFDIVRVNWPKLTKLQRKEIMGL